MVKMQVHFYSSELTECNSLMIAAPSEPGVKYPVLWLLPPMGLNHTRWSVHTDIEALAESKKMFIVMPDLKLSCGLDMVHGFKYHSMLVKELPRFLQSHFSVDLDRQTIAGVQEGAYAALYAAVQRPGQYRTVIALSAGSLTDEGAVMDGDRRFFHAFGTRDIASLRGSAYDIEKGIGELMDRTEVFVAYGEEDKYHGSAGRLGERIGKRKKENLEIVPGEMSWEEWYQFLKKRLP